MNATMLAVLNESERQLAAETERGALAALDEEAAIELETRVRRARNKYVSQYRRTAAARVAEHGGRGQARPENKRALLKAEAFERMLAGVSRRVAVLARQSASRLRAERLAAAKSEADWPGAGQLVPGQRRQGPEADPQPAGERALRSPARERQRAETQAATARKQARKDSRLSRAGNATGAPRC